MDFGNLLTKVLPWIGAAATGNVPALIAMAAKEVSGALGVDISANAQAIGEAVANATPEQLIAMKERDLAFQERMQAMGFSHVEEMAKLAVAELQAGFADTADARARDKAMRDSTGGKNSRSDVMLALTYLGLVGLVCLMVFRDIDANTALGGVVLLLIGKLIGQWETGFQFEFGSTRSNKSKDVSIENLSGAVK